MHTHLMGVADPTGCIPFGKVFIPGCKIVFWYLKLQWLAELITDLLLIFLQTGKPQVAIEISSELAYLMARCWFREGQFKILMDCLY
jgi:hypothetical protein